MGAIDWISASCRFALKASRAGPIGTLEGLNMHRPLPTGIERTFDEREIIVSKTDVTGKITYANDVFLRVSGYSEREILGMPHSVIRHPAMPRVVFKLLWDTLAAGREIFAYVINLAKSGDHYWVLAHVTPSRDSLGRTVGYHSNRRAADRSAISVVTDLYATLSREEERHPDRSKGMEASGAVLRGVLEARGVTYDELIFSLAAPEVRS
jgi:PAS domain S-box-containing protein